MDQLKKFTTNELIMLGGCVLMFIGFFLKWFAVGGGSIGGFSLPEYSVTGTHYFLQGWIPWLIAIALAAILIIKKFAPNVNLPENVGGQDWNMVYLIAAAVAAFLVLLRLLTGDSGTDRKIGLFLASLGVIGMIVGAFLKYQAKEPDTAPASGGGTPPSTF